MSISIARPRSPARVVWSQLSMRESTCDECIDGGNDLCRQTAMTTRRIPRFRL